MKRFNSHWEVESHWTDVLRPEGVCSCEVSIPIGKLSLIGLEMKRARGGRVTEFQFPLGS